LPNSKPSEQAYGWRAILDSGLVGRLALLCFGVWLHAADGLMVATIIPAIVADIGGATLIAWTFALYEVGSIVAGAASALVVVRFGLRVAMSTAGVLYMLGCLLSAASPEMPIMLAGRLVQGFGGGSLVALSFISVIRLFPRELVPRAVAAMSLIWGVSAFTGPLVGGLFAELHLWRGAFVFFALQAAVLSLWIFKALGDDAEKRSRQEGGRFPGWRLTALSLGVISIASAGIDVSFARSTSCVVLGIGLLLLFLLLDSRQVSHRLLPRRPLDPRHGVGAALLMVFCFTAATIAISVYGPILMTVLLGASALEAGYVLALSSIGWSVLAILTSSARERHDGALILAGMGVLTLSIVGFIVAVPNGPLALIALFAFLEGAGFGMAWTFILRKATALAVGDERDRIASALPTVQRLGYAVGASYVGIVANVLGFSDNLNPAVAHSVAFWLFVMCLPLAGIGLAAAVAFVLHGRRREVASAT
jgi:MFS family permease